MNGYIMMQETRPETLSCGTPTSQIPCDALGKRRLAYLDLSSSAYYFLSDPQLDRS